MSGYTLCLAEVRAWLTRGGPNADSIISKWHLYKSSACFHNQYTCIKRARTSPNHDSEWRCWKNLIKQSWIFQYLYGCTFSTDINGILCFFSGIQKYLVEFYVAPIVWECELTFFVRWCEMSLMYMVDILSKCNHILDEQKHTCFLRVQYQGIESNLK